MRMPATQWRNTWRTFRTTPSCASFCARSNPVRVLGMGVFRRGYRTFAAVLLLTGTAAGQTAEGNAQAARALMDQHRAAQAVDLWRAAIGLDGSKIDYSLGLAAALYDSGDTATAQKTML